MAHLPLTIAVYDRDLQPMDWVGAPLSVDLVLRHNAAGSLTFELDADDEQVEALNTPGARVVVQYSPDPDDPASPRRRLSGRVHELEGTTTGAQTRAFTVVDDWQVFARLLGWPNPAGPITAQGDEEAYWRSSGPAETVLKEAVSVNAHRSVPAVTVVPSLGRGDPIAASLRFHPLADRLFPAVDQAGVGVSVLQGDGALVVDCYTPATYPATLTEESGIVAAGSYTITAPVATRAVVLGGGEGTARIARLVVDAAAEAEWGFTAEVVVDARDTTDTALLDQRGAEALAEGAATASVTATLSETEEWRFGATFDLGDLVPIQLNGAPVITDVVREVAITWTPGDGLVVTPRVGDIETTATAVIGRAIRKIAAAQRDERVSI